MLQAKETNQDKLPRNMKRIIKMFFQLPSNLVGKLKSKNPKTNLQKNELVQYFEAKHFFNDLDIPDDYYLRVSPIEKKYICKKG